MTQLRHLLSLALAAAPVLTVAMSSVSRGAPFDKDGPITKQAVPYRWIAPLLPEEDKEPAYPSYEKDDRVGRAKDQVNAGQYRRALATLYGVKKGDAVTIALLRATALMELGREEEASRALSDPAVADDAKVQVLSARVLGRSARYPEAVSRLKEVIAAHPDSVPAHFYLGWFREHAGDVDGAKQAYAWFVEKPQDFLTQWLGQRDSFNDAEEVTLIGRALDRWATLNLRYQDNRQLHNVILGMFTRAYDVIDRDNRAAHIAAARYFESHDDQEEAGNELQQVLEANPHSVEAWALLGNIQLEEYNQAAADAAVSAVREVNPTSIDADLLEARSLLFDHQPKPAAALLRGAIERQPKNLEAIGLLAGAEALMLHDDQTAELLKQADAIDPASPAAYYECGRQLDRMKQYERAEQMYGVAVARAPWLTAARNYLGLVYTQSGDEDSARAVLDAAHALDPFNVKSTNYLRLLDDMKAFGRVETPHFVLMCDPRDQPIVFNYVGDYMESVYAQVCADFQFEPRKKTIIEVFPTSDAFAVRTAGMPGLETFGASFGPVVTAIAPRPGQTMGPYNWARVIKHEFTHVMNMAATDNRCPRWLTEGCAVWEERVPFRFAWVPEELYNRATQGKLFTIDKLGDALLHPRGAKDGEMAYMEGFWIVRYLRDAYGPDAVVKLLSAYRDGKNDFEAFPAAIGKPINEFQPAFFDWAKQQVSTWGYDEATTKQVDELKKQGEQLIKERKYAEALPVWEQIAKLHPMDLLPHERLAGLYMTKAIHQPAKAIDHLEQIQTIELKDDRYAKQIARLYQAADNLPEAQKAAMLAVYVSPYDIGAHELLKNIADASGDAEAVSREEKVIDALQKLADDEEAAKKKAEESGQ